MTLTPDEIDDRIAAWHQAPSDSHIAQMPLYEYLCWTWKEYKCWLETGDQPNGHV